MARRARVLARVLVVVVALASSALPVGERSASAYVRGRTEKTFKPIFWREPGQVLEVATPPAESGVSTNDLRNAARAALETWSYPQISCTATSLRLTAETTPSQVSGRDGVNRIIMRAGAWCRDPIAMTNCVRDPEALALTTIFSQNTPGAPDDGAMFEADIEINAVGRFLWAALPDGFRPRDYPDTYDLQSVLTHESGHFIGLGHNCHVDPKEFLIDDQGRPAPDCGDPPLGIEQPLTEATMFPSTEPDDTRQRMLTSDEKRAACEIYPLGEVPIDDWAGGAACAVAPASASATSPSARCGGALLALLAAWGLARRRSRGR